MVLHDSEAEISFTRAFDGRFPYDKPEASLLIQQGWQISLNAAFCVLNELCRPPFQGAVDRARLQELVAEWESGPDHPIKAPILRAAHNLIAGTTLPSHDSIELMKRVGEYDGQRAALGIAYFASASDSPEADDAMTQVHEEIRAQWDARGV